MSFRHLLLAASVTAWGVPAIAAAQPAPVIATEAGQVAGAAEEGVESWKGIPFAAPPVGELRWRAPQPAAKWDGVKQTVTYRNDCMQVPFPGDAAPLGTTPAEDCLYLNIWRPAGVTANLPVVFWIYGGGFVNGGSSPPTYSGAQLARQGVLFVSANYRLGRFGTFVHPQLTAENADDGLLGNYGYLDQLAALHWIQRNIAAFGGDPANVTIVGESAGGMSVHALVTSPLAKGLFAKAVVMSGGNGDGMGKSDFSTVEKIGVDFARSKDIAPDDPQALARLRALSGEQVTDGLNLIALFGGQGARTFASPFADGKIAVDVATAYASGAFQHVPMMIGATSADMDGRTGFMIAGARQLAAIVADKGVPVYEYRFSYVADSVGQPGAQHATDIPFFFDTTAIKYGDQTTPRDVAMGKAMSAYLTNFAKTGDPNGSGLPDWPRYARATDEIMDFAENGQPIARKDPWGPEIDAATSGTAGQ